MCTHTHTYIIYIYINYCINNKLNTYSYTYIRLTSRTNTKLKNSIINKIYFFGLCLNRINGQVAAGNVRLFL